jgi:HNH endonuclease
MSPPSDALCECGCGQPTRLAPRTYSRRGWVKGQPVRFVSGHNSRVVNPASLPGVGEKISAAKRGKPGKCGTEASAYKGPPEERFRKLVAEPDGHGCHLWLGTKDDGYGKFVLEGKRHVRAHRYAYALTRAPVDEDLCIHHLCGERACVNPDHLQPATRSLHSKLHAAKRRAA